VCSKHDVDAFFLRDLAREPPSKRVVSVIDRRDRRRALRLFDSLPLSPTVVMTVQPIRLRHLDRGAADAGAAGVHQDGLSGLQLWHCRTACSSTDIANAIGAQAASRIDTPAGTGTTRRASILTSSRGESNRRGIPLMPLTFSHRLSRPSRQALQVPQVSAPYMTTGSPVLKAVTPAPTAAISPAASAPTPSGSLRLTNAMPRKPHRSRWFQPDRLDADLHLVRLRGRRSRDVGKLDLAVGNEGQRTHRVSKQSRTGAFPAKSRATIRAWKMRQIQKLEGMPSSADSAMDAYRRRKPAVNRQDGAGHVAGLRRHQEGDNGRDVFRRRESAAPESAPRAGRGIWRRVPSWRCR